VDTPAVDGQKENRFLPSVVIEVSMKFQFTAVAVAAVACLFASNASAAEPVTAKLQTAITQSKKVVAGGAVFACSGDTCTAATPASDTTSRAACRQLVRAVGPVSTFGSETKPLSAEQLETCNGSAKK